MDKDILKMLKKIVINDVLIGGVFAIFIFLSFKFYWYIFLIGLLVALINFILSSSITNFVITRDKYKTLLFLSFTLRILMISVLGMILFSINKYNVIFYIVGFITHFLSIILYGVTQNES